MCRSTRSNPSALTLIAGSRLRLKQSSPGELNIWANSRIADNRELSHCRIRGLNAEYSKSVRKFTSTYVRPIIRMQP